jgi:predicted PurR-regulated permease PerM
MNAHTERERMAALVFYAVIILLGYLMFQLVRPFLVPLAWACVLAISFYPTHVRLERRLGRGRASLASTVCVALLVIVPMLVVASAFVSQASQILEHVPRLVADMPGFAQRWVRAGLRYVPGGETVDVAAALDTSARRVATFLSSQAAAVVQDVLVFVTSLVITIFALFFLFRDASSVMTGIRRILPLQTDVRERLIHQTRALVTASVTSALIVAAAQGILGGLAFWVLGLPAPVFWGVVMALLCLLPLGAWVVWAPAAIWLMVTGSVGRGLVLAALGVGVVSAVDNVLRPILLSEHSEMNGLLLFISLLGGVIAFGSVGLVLGPVVMALGIALSDAFTAEGSSAS